MNTEVKKTQTQTVIKSKLAPLAAQHASKSGEEVLQEKQLYS